MISDTFDLTEYCINEVVKHGKKGDKTLDCMGITIDQGRIMKAKAYYLGNNKAREENLHTEPFKSVYERFSTLMGTKGVSLSNIAKFDTQGEDAFALYFSTSAVAKENLSELFEVFTRLSEKNESFMQELKRDVDYSIGFQPKENCPIMQLGVQMDGRGNIFATKYYMFIKESNWRTPEITDRVADFINYIGKRSECGYLKEKAAVLYDNRFYPTLMGVNTYSDGRKKQKIYFDSGLDFSFDRNVVENAYRVAGRFGIDEIVNRNFLTDIHEHKLYVRGFGVNLLNESENRIYLQQS